MTHIPDPQLASTRLRHRPGGAVQRYPEPMEQDANPQSDVPRPTGVGTPEGLAQAMRLLDGGRAGMPEQDWADLRVRFGRRERQIA